MSAFGGITKNESQLGEQLAVQKILQLTPVLKWKFCEWKEREE